ncbi:MAG: 2-C-methyl-D-erythritol 2,4-cyclodiphosphate synthase [Deltaproteobacteria bacterium]|nr:2-C-methyl-D-erythritol 2,4-cyclodiphosphate synthase [Deltaproteobacteria bacterium]
MRVGVGFDVHRLVDGRQLILGGVEIPFEKGLLGHSDADVLLHAISDAILGAMSEDDIGVHFPDTDADTEGIDSAVILATIAGLTAKNGYRIVNVDSVLVAQEPRIAPYRAAMKERIARILSIEPAMVGIKGKTTEGLGFTGRGEGIAAHAVVLIEKL